MFVCMARQNIEHTTDKEDSGMIGDSSIFPIIFDAQTGMEIQIGGTYWFYNNWKQITKEYSVHLKCIYQY